jgi:hypothetical protein
MVSAVCCQVINVECLTVQEGFLFASHEFFCVRFHMDYLNLFAHEHLPLDENCSSLTIFCTQQCIFNQECKLLLQLLIEHLLLPCYMLFFI